MIAFENRTEHVFSLELVEKITDSLTDKEIELILTDNADIRQINKTFRHLDKPTDVLSFPYEEMPMAPLGSIIVSADFVFSGAREHGHTPEDEFALLYIHGLLHLLGYDHEVDNGEMRRKEASIIKKFSLPESLIIRTEG